MVRPAIQVEGLRELRRMLKAAENAAGLAMLKAAHKSAADLVVARALPNVPVRSGALRASVRALGSQAKGTAKAGGARVPYAAAIHWGWPRRGIRPQPFLQNALDQVEQQIPDVFSQSLERDVLSKVR